MIADIGSMAYPANVLSIVLEEPSAVLSCFVHVFRHEVLQFLRIGIADRNESIEDAIKVDPPHYLVHKQRHLELHRRSVESSRSTIEVDRVRWLAFRGGEGNESRRNIAPRLCGDRYLRA